MTKLVVIVANYNSVIGVQSTGNFRYSTIKGDRSLVNSLGDHNFEQVSRWGRRPRSRSSSSRRGGGGGRAHEAREVGDRGGAGTAGGQE